jgi:hypothetical protein
MDNDIEYGNIEVKYYLSCVSETPLWNSGIGIPGGIPGTAYLIVGYIEDIFDYGRLAIHAKDPLRAPEYGLPVLNAGSLLSAATAGKKSANLVLCPFALNRDYPPVTFDHFLRAEFGVTCSRKSSADHSSWDSIQI